MIDKFKVYDKQARLIAVLFEKGVLNRDELFKIADLNWIDVDRFEIREDTR